MPTLKRTWSPHPKQRAIMADDTRFRTVPAGRRFGKTTLARNESFEFAYENPDVLVGYFAPTDDDARDLAFDPLVDAIPTGLLDGEPKKTPPREIRLINGSRIRFRSTKSSTRGRGYDHVVIDEAGDVENNFFPSVIRPTLSDTGGSAIFIGTPRGKNWFHTMFERGNDPDKSEWSSWTATTYDNPHVADSEVEAARRDLPERVFKQEYLAEFVADDGAVFGNVRERNVRPYDLDGVAGVAPYSTGIDLARSSNYLVATTLDADGMLVGFLRSRGGSWAAAGRAMSSYLADYPGVAYLDATRDNKVVEDLARETPEVQIEPVRFTAQTKQNMVENLAARLETNDIVLPDPDRYGNDEVEALLAELSMFEYDTTPAGNVRYGAPEGENDDTVDALALAAKESEAPKSTW
ncbi:large subunit terminase [Halorubrum phage Hardycor1]|nr:large subunit terminase [Halorubrum phage Hardycor1]